MDFRGKLVLYREELLGRDIGPTGIIRYDL